MEFSKSVIEIIKERFSCRSYDSAKIDAPKLQALREYLEKMNDHLEGQARFLYVETDPLAGSKNEKLGTYGMIAGANAFLVGVIGQQGASALEFGYCFERVVLFATDLDLGTCWLGGTFNRSEFAQKANLQAEEWIPIVSPVGGRRAKPRLMDGMVRAVAGSNKRKPWSELFFDGSVPNPLSEQSAGAYFQPLEMVRLAPSASNKQPWRIVQEKDRYHFFLCRTKGYLASRYDMQMNDIGIAKCHFELTANELGLAGKWDQVQGVKTPAEREYMTTWTCKSGS